MNLKYVHNGSQLPDLRPKSPETKEDSYIHSIKTLRVEALERKWHRKLLLTVAVGVILLVGLHAWHLYNPKLVFIPVENEKVGDFQGITENESDFESKFLQISEVLKYVIEELEKQNISISGLSKGENSGSFILEQKAEALVQYQRGTVVAKSANVRRLPNVDSKKVLTLEKGAEVLIDKTLDNWSRIIMPTGQRAWVLSKLLKVGNDD